MPSRPADLARRCPKLSYDYCYDSDGC